MGQEKLLNQVGGAMLAIGILILVVMRWHPGLSSIGGLLPYPDLLLYAGFGLAITGSLLIAVEKTLELRPVKQTGWGAALPPKTAEKKFDALFGEFTGGQGNVSSNSRTPVPRRQPVSGLEMQKRVCLKPVWPQHETSHWVGGLPNLPVDVHWPEINGRPASFLAQISMSEMPETLWQGRGPRTGWLVYFGDSETDGDITVLHVEGEVFPRAQPRGVSYHWSAYRGAEGMKHVIGAAADVPPKWFIEIADQATLGSVEDMTAEVTTPDGWAYKYKDEKTVKWVWEKPSLLDRRSVLLDVTLPHLKNGTSWGTVFALLAALRMMLGNRSDEVTSAEARYTDMQQRIGREIAELSLVAKGTGEAARQAHDTITDKRKHLAQILKSSEDAQTVLQILLDRFAGLTAIEVELKSASKRVEYDPAFAAELHALVREAEAEIKLKTSRIGPLVQEDFMHIMEHQARLAYTSDPASVPADLYDLYAPLWQQECEDVAIFIGTNADTQGVERQDARLLDMPPNPLTGITIGDHSRFYADIPLRDLDRGTYTRAYASNTHGM